MLPVRYSLTLFNLFEFEQNVRSQHCLPSSISNKEKKRREIITFISIEIKLLVVNKKIVKQVAGIDVAQKELVVTVGRMYDDWSPELYETKSICEYTQGV